MKTMKKKVPAKGGKKPVVRLRADIAASMHSTLRAHALWASLSLRWACALVLVLAVAVAAAVVVVLCMRTGWRVCGMVGIGE